jgi:uncharacterized protein YabN with tetrapyrrole methylase and pyrophosphatase domain
VLDDVPAGLPAMTRAVKLTKRAARVGFDWPSTDEVLDKLARGDRRAEGRDRGRRQGQGPRGAGRPAVRLANLARKLDVEPEDALRATNAKFARRFAFIEAELAKDGRRRTSRTWPRWTACGTTPRRRRRPGRLGV